MTKGKPKAADTGGDYNNQELLESDTVPRILDGVKDQEGTRWIYYGTGEQACWFSPIELVSDNRAVLARVAKAGTDLLTRKSQDAFKKEIEEYRGYREALVAARPGWLEKAHYVYGNGDVQRPDGDSREVIITFEPNTKFTPVGTLEGWQASIGSAVMDQPIPLFILMYAFVGMILRFAPEHVQNPQAELVGEGESAKSTLLMVGASAHAGDLTSDVGGAETWDMTVNVHDLLKRAHADSLLALDEVNLAGLDSKGQREMVQKVAFKAAANGSRKRLTDTDTAPNVQVATLSTSNVPQRDLIKAHAAVVDAFSTRILTIAIPKEHKLGVFRTVPDGFASARAAAEHLRKAVNKNYGMAGRAFVKWLVAEAIRDEGGLRRKIESLMNEFHAAAREEAVAKGKARGEKTVALTFAAGMLGKEAGIIPEEWGAVLPATLAVYHSLAAAGDAPFAPPAIERIRAFRARNRSDIGRAKRLKRPYEEAAFQRKAGVLRRMGNRIELLIPAKRFQQEFPDHRDMMKRLRDEGLARTEGGKQPKNTIKLPGRICRTAPRVYCITVVDDVGTQLTRRKRAS